MQKQPSGLLSHVNISRFERKALIGPSPTSSNQNRFYIVRRHVYMAEMAET